MVDWLAVWGVSQVTSSVSRPILEGLAKDAAKDAATSYVGQCFKSVYSVIHRDALTKATGLALRELLDLVENELVRSGFEDDELRDWIDDLHRFITQDDVRLAIASLFLTPDYCLDSRVFATAWQQRLVRH